MDFVAAFRKKYEEGFAVQPTHVCRMSVVNAQAARREGRRVVCLPGAHIRRAFEHTSQEHSLESIQECAPNAVELYLEHNLFESLDEIGYIVRALPKLEVLDISEQNRFVFDARRIPMSIFA